jgi:SM-20-related protein
MSALNLDVLRTTPVIHEPFDYVVAPDIVTRSVLDAIDADFPDIELPGSFPLDALEFGPGLAKLNEELQSPAMTEAISKIFDIDLRGRPTMLTARGWCRSGDGQIHCDSKEKLITVLIYLNHSWEPEGGRLRLLRSANDLEDFVAEVLPSAGTMIAFRCTDHSWHGHKPYEGQRRSLQLNWVTDGRYVARERRRHGFSAAVKRAKRALGVS